MPLSNKDYDLGETTYGMATTSTRRRHGLDCNNFVVYSIPVGPSDMDVATLYEVVFMVYYQIQG